MDSSTANSTRDELLSKLMKTLGSATEDELSKAISMLENRPSLNNNKNANEPKPSTSRNSNRGTSVCAVIKENNINKNFKNEVQVKQNEETSAFGNFKAYKRRVGTTDSGRDYEYKMLALLYLRCILQKPEDAWMVTNADDVGDFDDIILYVKLKATPGTTYMLQMKHEDKQSDLTQSDFTHKNKPFNLVKHAKGFAMLRQTLANSDKSSNIIENLDSDNIISIFFTNRTAPTSGLPFFQKCAHNLSFLNTNSDNCVYKLDFGKTNGLGLENLDYCQKVYFLSNQISEADTEAHILQEMEKLVKQLGLIKINCKSIAKSLTEYVINWAKHKFDSWYLTMDKIFLKLAQLFLSGYTVDLNKEPCAFYDCPTKYIWNTIVLDRTVIHVDYDEGTFAFLKEFIGSELRKYLHRFEDAWSCNLSNKNKKALFKHAGLKTLMFNIVGKHGNMSMLDVYECLWLDRRIPLLLVINHIEEYRNVLKIFAWSQVDLKVIIINNTTGELPASNLSTLADVNAQNTSKILEQPVKLQGRPGYILKDLVDESMHHLIKTKDIIQILSQVYNIGNVYKPTDYFIERRLSKVLIKFEALLLNETFIIRNEASECALVNKLECLNLVCRIGCSIIITHDESLDLKSRNPIHRLTFHGDDYLEWGESLGSVKNLKQYLIENCESSDTVFQQIQNMENCLNGTHILSGCPGMGKTMLVDFITNEVTAKVWVLKIVLNDHDEYYESLQDKKDLSAYDHIKYFSAEILNHSTNVPLSKAIFEKFLHERKIIFLIDGFDEISILYKNEVTEIIRRLHACGFHIWITTRPHMTAHLEEQFGTIAHTLTPFTVEDQKRFMFQYFGSDWNHELINAFVEKLLEAARNNLNDNDQKFLGIPLQCRLLADVFCDEIKEGVANFNEKFDLLYLYEEFTRKKTKIHCIKHGKCAKEMRMFFYNYQKLFALKIMFNKHALYELNIDKQLNEYYRDNPEGIEILQREGLLVVRHGTVFSASFVHRTFAEFLAAQWLAENYNSTDWKIKQVADVLMSRRFGTSGYGFLFRLFDAMLCKGFPLHKAVVNERISEALILIKSQHVDKLDNARRSVLHVAALRGIRTTKDDFGDDQMADIIEKLPTSMVESLIKPDQLGYNPLDYALKKWALAVADRICQKFEGVDISIGSEDYKTDFLSQHIHHYAFLFRKLTQAFICFECLEHGLDEHTNISDYFRKRFYSGCDSLYKNIENYINELCVKTFAELFEKLKLKSGIHFAVAYAHDDNLRGVPSNDVNRLLYGHTVLCCAIKRKRPEVFIVLEKFNINLACADGTTALHAACQVGYDNLIETLLKKGADINKTNKSGKTPLFIALENRRIQIAQLLLKHKAEVNQTDLQSNSCLHVAAKEGFDDIVSELVCRNANINRQNIFDETPMFLAIRNKQPNIVKILLDNGATVDNMDHFGNSYFHEACTKGLLDVIPQLIGKGLDINRRNGLGETPLFLALKHKHAPVAKLLLEHQAKAEGSDSFKHTCLHMAAAAGQDDILHKLIQRGGDINAQNQNGEIPFVSALQNRHLSTAKILLKYGTRLDFTASWGNTCLHTAAKYGDSDIILQLICKNLDINKQNSSGQTPLLVALESKNIPVANILLQSADIYTIDNLQNSCLHAAAKSDFEITLRLVDKLDISKPNKRGETPVYLALENQQIAVAKLLLQSGAQIDHVEKHGNNLLHAAAKTGHNCIIRHLIAAGLDVNKQNMNGQTPLFLALQAKHIEAAQLLFTKCDVKAKNGSSHLHYAALGGCLEEWVKFLPKPDLTATNNNNQTLLHFAILKQKFKDDCDVQDQIATVRFLVSNGVDVSAQDTRGYTVLHLASRSLYMNDDNTPNRFNQSVAGLFLDAGIDISLKNEDRRTALDVAIGNRNDRIVALIKEKMCGQNKT